jgi:hypothetical protein
MSNETDSIEVQTNENTTEIATQGVENNLSDEIENEEETSTDSDDNMEDDAEENEETEDSDTQEKEGEEVSNKPKSNGFKKRIDKLKRKEADALREVEYWKAKALQEKNQLEKEEPKASVQSDSKPTPDDFETQEEFIDALTDWKLNTALKQKDENSKKDSLRQKEIETAQKWQSNIEKFSQENNVEDFGDFIEENLDGISASETVERAILESDLGPNILYHLAENPDLAERISKLSDTQALMEIGVIKSQLSKPKQTKQTTKKKTNAPTPIASVRGGGVANKSLSNPNLTQAEYEALRAQKSAV